MLFAGIGPASAVVTAAEQRFDFGFQSAEQIQPPFVGLQFAADSH